MMMIAVRWRDLLVIVFVSAVAPVLALVVVVPLVSARRTLVQTHSLSSCRLDRSTSVTM